MNRKNIARLITLLLILTLPSWAGAETLIEAELRAKIAALVVEVSALQSELDAMKAKEESGRVLQTFRLIDSLSQGVRSEEVKTLQILLAKDSHIYPEGYVTGYYGALTSAAVVRFTSKQGKPSLSVESIGVPRIFGIAATTTDTTMTIVWKTGVPTSAKIWWGSPGPLDAERMTPVSTPAFSEDHRAIFSGIIYASTTYAFIIAASDKDGNTSTTTEQIYVAP
jgi:peptidoglycan hydrolase-like protein with peptidoglycan-binding domain